MILGKVTEFDFTLYLIQNTNMNDAYDDVIIEPEDDGAEEKGDAKIKKLRDDLKKVKAERDEYLAGWQRSKADYVNLSRRTREQEESRTRSGVMGIARSIITVFDSLEAAQKAAEAVGGSVFDGIVQVTKQLEHALKENGVERFTPQEGEQFNPNFHEPMQTVATESEVEDNTVSETFQSGYKAGETAIRPARVSVKKYG